MSAINLPYLRQLWISWLVIALASAGRSPAEEPDPEAKAAKAFQVYAQETAASYELHAPSTDGRPLALREEPILRWSNPLAGRKAHGDVFLWTDEGRPAAVLSLYEYTTPDGIVHEHHEFCSLATGKLFCQGASGRVWSPATAGVTLLPLDDAPQPADSAVGRLSQMRQLAGRFSGSKITREERAKRDLRLLTQPIVRYESEFHGVADGALFALVEATDPEIFLVVEARQLDGDLRWHYALARMNSLWLAASYQNKQVWEADVLPWRVVVRSTEKPYALFPLR
jgi:hypothetical protein